MKVSRRELSFLLPALLATTAPPAQAATLPSKVYGYSDLEVRTNQTNNNKQRPVFEGATHTGFMVEMHETELAPGMMPHSSHHHIHEEMLILREGTVGGDDRGQDHPAGAGIGGLRGFQRRARLAQCRRRAGAVLHHCARRVLGLGLAREGRC